MNTDLNSSPGSPWDPLGPPWGVPGGPRGGIEAGFQQESCLDHYFEQLSHCTPTSIPPLGPPGTPRGVPEGSSIRIQSGANGTFGAIKFRFQQGVQWLSLQTIKCFLLTRSNRKDNEFNVKIIAKWTQPLLFFRTWIKKSFPLSR